MKWLQNKAVVGVLGILAILLVMHNLGLFQSRPGQRTGAARTPAPAKSTAAPVSSQQGKHAVPAPVAPLAQAHMEVPAIAERLPLWLSAPRRDPFQPFTAKTDYPGAAAVLSLTAIWRQTGSQLAVINQKVLEEGDIIEAYRLERIEGDRVWVNGPVGMEPLDLKLVLTEALHKRKTEALMAGATP